MSCLNAVGQMRTPVPAGDTRSSRWTWSGRGGHSFTRLDYLMIQHDGDVSVHQISALTGGDKPTNQKLRLEMTSELLSDRTEQCPAGRPAQDRRPRPPCHEGGTVNTPLPPGTLAIAAYGCRGYDQCCRKFNVTYFSVNLHKYSEEEEKTDHSPRVCVRVCVCERRGVSELVSGSWRNLLFWGWLDKPKTFSRREEELSADKRRNLQQTRTFSRRWSTRAERWEDDEGCRSLHPGESSGESSPSLTCRLPPVDLLLQELLIHGWNHVSMLAVAAEEPASPV